MIYPMMYVIYVLYAIYQENEEYSQTDDDNEYNRVTDTDSANITEGESDYTDTDVVYYKVNPQTNPPSVVSTSSQDDSSEAVSQGMYKSPSYLSTHVYLSLLSSLT